MVVDVFHAIKMFSTQYTSHNGQGLPFLKIITCPTSRILKFFDLLIWNKEEKICSNPLARLVILLGPGHRAVGNSEPWMRDEHSKQCWPYCFMPYSISVPVNNFNLCDLVIFASFQFASLLNFRLGAQLSGSHGSQENRTTRQTVSWKFCLISLQS